MTRKQTICFAIMWLCAIAVGAQPRPYEIDNSFTPTTDYLQKAWEGTYDGLEPNSRMIITVRRTLKLYADMTYINEIRGKVKDKTDEIVLKRESGTYTYDMDSRTLTYAVMADSTLDVNDFLQGMAEGYEVHHYADGEDVRTNTEVAQFTAVGQGGNRLWVAFDQQLLSPVDRTRQAVYTMSGTPIDEQTNGIERVAYNKARYASYDVVGRKITSTGRKGLRITAGKKVLKR